MANKYYIPQQTSTPRLVLDTMNTIESARANRERTGILKSQQELDERKLGFQQEKFGTETQQRERELGIAEQGLDIRKKELPAYDRPFTRLHITDMKGIVGEVGLEDVAKPILDELEEDARQGATTGRVYGKLKAKWPKIQDDLYSGLEKKYMKALEEGDNVRAQDLRETMRMVTDDKDGSMILNGAFPQTARAIKMQEEQLAIERMKAQPDAGGFTLSPGQTRYDAAGNPVANAPQQAPAVSGTLEEFETINFGGPVPGQRGSKEYQEKYLDFLKQRREATTAPNRTEPAVLRKEFISQSSDFVKVRDSWNRIKASAENPSPAGDLAMIFNYMKVLDPGSVVRESEFATAAQTGAYGERIKAAVGRVIQGNRLSDEMRNDFKDRAKKLYEEQEKSHNKLREEYDRLSTGLGVEPSHVIIDYAEDQAKIQSGQFDVGEVYEGADGTRKKYAGMDANGNHLWEDVQ